MQFYRRIPNDSGAGLKVSMWVIPGSRLLPTYRAAGRSGSRRTAPLQDQGLPEPAVYGETNFVQVLPLLALATAVAMNAIPSTPSSTVG